MQERRPDRFIAVNLLPARQDSNKKSPLELLQEQIKVAIEMGFTHIWLNPISETLEVQKSICHRRCLDTGIMTDLYASLYAPDNPKKIRNDFPKSKLREILALARQSNVYILVDFVWKHLAEQSSVFKQNPKWKGKKLNDISEYPFAANDETRQAILNFLKEVIDIYLDSQAGFGFDGLRIDAASHFIPEVRIPLYQYIREKYPNAILFEESLFDRTQELGILKLAESAEEYQLYCDFITGNLYYQKPNAFGVLPSPEEMGDKNKLRIAKGNSISFTGNHDHFSISWSIILTMAATRFLKDEHFIERTRRITTSPMQSDKPDPEQISETITAIAKGVELIEAMETSKQSCIRYLLPYANEITRELLDDTHSNHLIVFNEFRLTLFASLSDRTLVSPSGYFMLYSEITSLFETPRIFLNKEGKHLPFLALTVKDLMADEKLTESIIADMAKDKKYANHGNFLRVAKTKGVNEVKSNNKKSLKKASNTIDKKELTESYRLWLPFIIDYLRNNPEENLYDYFVNKNDAAMTSLCQKLGLRDFIQGINRIFAAISTPACSDYHTFKSQDRFKIIIRCADKTTDIIILNLDPDQLKSINDLDIQKIALWFQARKFPPRNTECTNFAIPFSNQEVSYAESSYSYYWCIEKDEKRAFHSSYDRVIGKEPEHQTKLYLGYGLTCDLSSDNPIEIVTHLKTERQIENEIFHKNRFNKLELLDFSPKKEETDEGIAAEQEEAVRAERTDNCETYCNFLI